jgi:signal transduction histidine kinase
VWVSDTGVGIEPGHVGRVFERFYKTDPSRAAGTGTGLGLAIAKHLVLAHGGQIWAESQGPGRGSTFRVTLPAMP